MKKILFIVLFGSCGIGVFAFQPDLSCAENRFQYLETTGTAFLEPDTIPVRIQFEKTSLNDMSVLFIPDTAKQVQDIGPVLNKGYAELMRFTQEAQLKAKRFLGWYYSPQSPWIMDIAVETDKLPSELKGRIKSRIQKGGEVLIAHMWGPYSELRQAYVQIEKWLKENNRLAKSNPFEVYLTDPVTAKDPSEIQTDIYQPLQ
jgi:effector-binding domain-containing protein